MVLHTHSSIFYTRILLRLLAALAGLTLAGCGSLPAPYPPAVVTLTSPVIPTANAPEVTQPAGQTAFPAFPTAALPSAVVIEPTADPAAPLWVTNPTDSRLLRIDPQTNTITDWVSLDGVPEIAVWDEAWVWVLDRTNDRLYRFNAANLRDVTPVVLPEGDAETIVLGSGSGSKDAVWVGMVGKVDLNAQVPSSEIAVDEAGEDEREILPPGWVVKIDPQRAEVVDWLDVQPVVGVSAQGSTLWVLSHAVIDTPVQVLDLNSRQGMAVPIRNAPEWVAAEAMAVTPEGLWLFSSAHARIFHADLGGRVNSSIPLEVRKPTGYADLLYTGGSLWAAAPWGLVIKIDPRTNHVQGQVDLGVPLSELLQGGGSVWALSQQTGALYRLDPSGSTISVQIATGNPVRPTIIPSPTPRVVIWQPCPDAPSSRLKVGDIAYVTKDPAVPNRVRKEANLEAEILGLVNPGASVRITGGPTCAEGWVWWQVENADFSGWTSEGDKETYWLVPLIP